MGQGSHLMGTDRSDQPASPVAARTATVVVLSLGVGVVLGDAGVVTLALPEILRDFGAQVWGVAWVLIAFNLVLALVAVPGARLCVRGDPAVATAGGVVGFAAATTVCAVAPSLGVLIAARAAQAVGGALVIVGSLELLVAATGVERAGVRRWAAAGVAGAALGPVIGGLLTSAFSWRAIFVVQIPIVLLALPCRDRAAWPGRGAASAYARHVAGPPAPAGRPGACAAVGGAHGGVVPSGAAARGRLESLARRGRGRRHRGAGGGPGRRSRIPRCARRDAVRGGRWIGPDRRRSDRAGAPARCRARLDARAAGAHRPRPGAVGRLADRGRAPRPAPTCASRGLDDRRAARRRGRRPRDPHPDLHRRPAPRPDPGRGGDRAPRARRAAPRLHKARPRRTAGAPAVSRTRPGARPAARRSRPCECRRRKRPRSPPSSVASRISSSAPPPARSAQRSSSPRDWRC